MKHYLSEVRDVLESVDATQDGLKSDEAGERLQKNGPNKLREPKKVSLFVRFLKQLADPMIIILIVAAAVSAVIAVLEKESFADVIIIVAVVLINAVLGVVQESKAEKAIAALQEMTAATSKALRDGKIVHVKSQDLVTGDIILLEAGDSVPADSRIIESASLKIEEAALTGESVPVNKTAAILNTPDGQKDVPLGDRKNMAYMGSTVVYGRGKAVVVAVGMDTEMGKIATSLEMAKEEATPLQKKLGQLSKVLSFAVIGICVFIFLYKFIYAKATGSVFDFPTALDSFMIAVSLAVAAIPEGLATVVTIVLSIGVTKMSKRNAVIRKLTAVETLGCAQIICSDKTGTLTQNKMTVVECFCEDSELLGTCLALSSDAELDEDTNQAVGEPTECALVNYAYSIGLDKNRLKATQRRVGEAPFDSMRKMMSTICKNEENGELLQYTKGAPDEVLKRCSKMLSDGKIVELDDSLRAKILDENKRMASKALRVMCGAYKALTQLPTSFEPSELEKNLVFIGLAGMIDPVRPEVKAAIEECNRAGIRPVMITGDHKDTAVAIALELGIITDSSQALTGAQLDEMSDDELLGKIEDFSVYARVQPEHKVRIVNAWKQRGCITAMTGDGVNDSPSIKSADIGIGMGITGTDVTKGLADMVLADDNFATIVSAVEEGRRIYDNIRKSIQFLLSSNLSEVIAIFVATLFNFVILSPIHLLWINLITDTFPALALGVEPADEKIMKRPPRNSRDSIFANHLGIDVVYQGIMVAVLTLAAYFIGFEMENGYWGIGQSNDGITMAFLTLSMAEMFHAFNLRSRSRSVFAVKKQNWILWGAFGISLALTTLIIFVPALSGIFGLTPITIAEYFTAMGLAFLVVPIVEAVKLISGVSEKKKSKRK